MNLAELRNILKAKRHRRGSIDFEVPEVKVKLDENGHPVALIKREGSLAESIIEECMLIANETVAKHMDNKNLPFMYRVHEQPSEEKIERLNNLLAAFGLFVRQDEAGQIKPMDVQKVLAKVEGRPEERIISTVALRSMQQARYSEQSLGHFGLAARYYTHFTSPIRRYPDLIVHRLLRETFVTGSIPVERQEKLRSLLPEIADHSSERERLAIEAERETTDMKKIEYMADYVGEEFTGVISGVTAFGLFVELDNGVEGLVHVSTMTNDFYEYVEERFAMVGERTQQKYRLGDEVEVLLVRANIEERNLDFVLKGNGAGDPLAMKNAGRSAARGSKAASAVKENKNNKAAKENNRHRSSTERGYKSKVKKPSKKQEKLIGSDVVANVLANPLQPGKKDGSRHKAGKSPKQLPLKAEGRIEKAGLKENRSRNREERRNGSSYHRVYVTGLNNAVWPDPPGYRERKEREEKASAKKEKQARAPKHRPRPHRKTEGGTGNSK